MLNDEKTLFIGILIGILFVLTSLSIFFKYKPARVNTGIKFLNVETIIDIEDVTGKVVKITENQLLRSLIKNKYHIIEPLQTDGYILYESIVVEPGEIEDIKKKEGIIYVKSNFGHPLQKDEVISRSFSYVSNDSFISDNEYWVRRNSSETDKFKILVKFPDDRKYKSFVGMEKYLSYDEICQVQPKEIIIDSRYCLLWELENIDNTQYSYRLEWTW